MTRLAMSLLLIALVGCTTTARFDTNAPGAKLYLDGAFKGIMPCEVELNDGDTGYTLRAEHPDFHTATLMIRQQYAGSVSQQQTQTNVNGSSSAYGVGNGVNTNTNVYGTQNTQTYNTPVYAWPTRFLVTLVKSGATQAAPVPSPAPATTTTPATGQRGAFCSGCGKQFAGDAQFCSGCGARR